MRFAFENCVVDVPAVKLCYSDIPVHVLYTREYSVDLISACAEDCES